MEEKRLTLMRQAVVRMMSHCSVCRKSAVKPLNTHSHIHQETIMNAKHTTAKHQKTLGFISVLPLHLPKRISDSFINYHAAARINYSPKKLGHQNYIFQKKDTVSAV